MRVPVRSERDAFRLAYGLAAVVGLCVLVGYAIHPIAGIALFTLLMAGALVWDLASRDPERPARLREAVDAGRRFNAGPRVLVVANEALVGEALRDEILRGRRGRPVLEVLAPVLESRTHFVTTDIDRETEDARRRLRETLRWAHEHGLEARGEVGDPIDPYAGIADELRRYDIDEVIVTTHRMEGANWIEQGMLARMREELDIPVTHVVVDRDSERIEVDRDQRWARA